ncbi:MAG: T9SS type A sorting domain-containing protein [Flavisolibacter sp.]|nr:T9SS type A sorting domain-containing protein [Flavisolibacter sp.]
MSVNTGNGSETEAPLVSGSIGIYPNPVDDKFMLQVNNELTGSLKVQIVNLQGTVVKQFNLNKTNTGTSQFYLTIGELPTGQYILNATMKDWTLSQQLIRQ